MICYTLPDLLALNDVIRETDKKETEKIMPENRYHGTSINDQQAS